MIANRRLTKVFRLQEVAAEGQNPRGTGDVNDDVCYVEQNRSRTPMMLYVPRCMDLGTVPESIAVTIFYGEVS